MKQIGLIALRKRPLDPLTQVYTAPSLSQSKLWSAAAITNLSESALQPSEKGSRCLRGAPERKIWIEEVLHRCYIF
jgi:hypothetical protein